MIRVFKDKLETTMESSIYLRNGKDLGALFS